jgi:hypothetical protein
VGGPHPVLGRELTILYLTPRNIATLVGAHDGQRLEFARSAAGVWMIISPANKPFSPNFIEDIATTLRGLKAKSVAVDAAPADVGLAPAKTTITATTDSGAVAWLRIGTANTTGKWHAKSSARAETFLIAARKAGVFRKRLKDIKPSEKPKKP